MNQYVFILNDKGERITSLCDNTLSRDDIMAQAEHDYPNAQYVYSADGDSMLDEFMSGKLYVNGKFIEPDPYVPTKEDKINAIKAEYEPRFKTLEEAQRRLLLMEKPTNAISTQYIKLNNEMVARIKEVQ
ncbi:MAG: hypothetical protein E6183_00665 [Veillonella sp.]|jgi:hypothetical protein|uniref:hypothetical protein n=1 Tax=Veillonella TaxID=29465 RepID=UPI00257A6456|nr:hypothetical protein [Veillonella sp.]MBS6863618.1 hypothetical protein [Veillonella sp.]MDU1550808.1 hypothetical protein [Veillonella sp.]MDU5198134.1 hypothetical protein [Veillonella sp.]MDU5253548.1 hypothetical protein [Veillonella sp.]MDU6771431.1 hypothetical protein [Veillonella sp.]